MKSNKNDLFINPIQQTKKGSFEKLSLNKKNLIFQFLTSREKFKALNLNKNIRAQIEINQVQNPQIENIKTNYLSYKKKFRTTCSFVDHCMDTCVTDDIDIYVKEGMFHNDECIEKWCNNKDIKLLTQRLKYRTCRKCKVKYCKLCSCVNTKKIEFYYYCLKCYYDMQFDMQIKDKPFTETPTLNLYQKHQHKLSKISHINQPIQSFKIDSIQNNNRLIDINEIESIKNNNDGFININEIDKEYNDEDSNSMSINEIEPNENKNKNASNDNYNSNDTESYSDSDSNDDSSSNNESYNKPNFKPQNSSKINRISFETKLSECFLCQRIINYGPRGRFNSHLDLCVDCLSKMQ